MTQPEFSIDRRRFLLGTSGVVLAASVGCSPEAKSDRDQSVESRTDVPLRVLLVGSDQEADTLRRGWQAVSEQPLQIESIDRRRDQATQLAASVSRGVLETDVVIYPLALVAELHASDAITMLTEQEFEEIEQQSGDFYAALRNGAARYAADFIGVPQGAPLPALLAAAQLPDQFNRDTLDWQHYHQLVTEHWQGSAAEPTAPGWAAAMFLWRAASSMSWLFDRQTFEPLIESEPYVQTLQQMLETHQAYESELRTPGEIWNAVKAGQLQGGIGFPVQPSEDERVPVTVLDLPRSEQLARVLLDPFSPVASLSINCRQSVTAKRFIGWLSGGEGSSLVRQQIENMTAIRSEVAATAGDGAAAAAGTSGLNYGRWLATQLSSPLLLPTLQIRRAGQYYQVLDEQITATLKGDSEPAAALAAVAEAWKATTQEIGTDKQLRAWRRAQGMRG